MWCVRVPSMSLCRDAIQLGFTGDCAACVHLVVVLVCPVQVINDIRNRTGARVNLFDEEKNCGDRMLQVRRGTPIPCCTSLPSCVCVWSVASIHLASVESWHFSWANLLNRHA